MKIVKNPVIAIRTDASTQIGLGHLRRCLSLADALTDRGAKVVFHLFGDAFGRDLVKKSGYPIAPVQSAQELLCPLQGIEYHGVVADSYSFGANHFRAFSDHAPVVAVIDDLAMHPLMVDLVINQNLTGPDLVYQTAQNTQKLLGGGYALLAPEFRALRQPFQAKQRRLLVMMGGTDLHQQTEKVIAALSLLSPTYFVDVIIGAGAPSVERVKQAVAELPVVGKVHVNPDNVAPIMAKASLAVNTGGVSALELACLGVPSILVTVADNQVEAARALHKNGASLHLGFYENVTREKIAATIQKLLSRPEALEQMSRAGFMLVDGKGADRVADILLRRIVRETGMSWSWQNPSPRIRPIHTATLAAI